MLLLLHLLLQEDIGIGIGHRRTFDGIEHHLDLGVDLGLTGIFVLILQLHLSTIVARSQFEHTPAVLRTVDSTPGLTIPVLVIDTIDGLVLIGNGQTDVVALTTVADYLQVVEGIVHLLLTPVGQHVLLTILIGIGHLIGILQRLEQRQRPVVVAQHVVYLTLTLCTHCRLNEVDGLTLARLEDLLNLRLLNPAHHIGVGLVLQHLLLGIGQRGLRIGVHSLRELRLLVQLAVAALRLQRTLRFAGNVGGYFADQVVQRLTLSLSHTATPAFAVDIVFTIPDVFPLL